MDSIRLTACRLITAALALMASLGALNAQAQKFSVTTLQNLPDSVAVQGVAINNSGQVAGNSITADGTSLAVLWNGTTPTVLGGSDTGFTYSAFVTGMNNLGDVVGFDTAFKTLIDLWGGNIPDQCGNTWYDTKGTAINDVGQIAGILFALGVPYPPLGISWSNFCITNDWGYLGDPLSYGDYPTSINNAGVAVGYAYVDAEQSTQHAAQLSPNVRDMGTLGGKNSGANQVNNRGYVVGWADIPNNRSHAALWGPHTVASDLGTLGGKTSYASGINTQGDAVGSAQTLSNAWHAVLWTHLHYLPEDLNHEIGALTKQITLTGAAGTNDHCQVLANGYDNKTKVPHIYVLSLLNPHECAVVTANEAVTEREATGADGTAPPESSASKSQ
jgi:probable HAF family extracellular repeat protein